MKRVRIAILVVCGAVTLFALNDLTRPDDPAPPDRRAELVDKCVEAGLEQYDHKDTDAYLEQQTRADVERFWKRACTELARRGQLETDGGRAAPAGALRSTAGEVLRRMIERGELPPPRTTTDPSS